VLRAALIEREEAYSGLTSSIDPAVLKGFLDRYPEGRYALAKSFGRGAGWFWWSCQSGFLPDAEPTGPFATSDAAYRDALEVKTWPA
jgi:hypothetical protein